MRLARQVAVAGLVAALAVAGGCGGAKTDSPSDAPAGAPADAHAGVPAKGGATFESMTREERVDFMKRVVLPAMKTEFAAADPEEFKGMNCITCHGESAKDKTFKMPNPKLPKLPAATDAAGWAKLEKDEPEMVAFMKTKVVPKMAEMLGEAPYDPKTHEGFGCFGCHTASGL